MPLLTYLYVNQQLLCGLENNVFSSFWSVTGLTHFIFNHHNDNGGAVFRLYG